MDHKEFDELVARLASAANRREALKGLVGSSLAAVGITTAAADDAESKGKGGKQRASKENKGKGGKNRGAGKENKKGKGGGDNDGGGKGGGSANAEACIPTGKKCPSPKPRGRSGKNRKKPKQLGCDRCCQRRTTTDASGQTRCSCAPANTPCTDTRECCSGVCAGTGAARTCRLTT